MSMPNTFSNQEAADDEYRYKCLADKSNNEGADILCEALFEL